MADQFDALLKNMPAIAEAVNAFTSADVQKQAFTALVVAHGLPEEDVEPPGDNPDDAGGGGDNSSRRAKGATKNKVAKKAAPAKRKAGSSTPTRLGNLNLRPSGKQAFAAFATEKAPQSNPEKCLVSAYWLQHKAKLTGITASHIYTCFKEANWKVPNDLINALQVTKSTKGWLETSDMDAITVTIAGENHVEHDLPKTKK
jgi:hypothetical protein